MTIPQDLSGLSFLATSALVLLWDVLLAGQIARARRQARDLLAVTALAGLLIAPAVVIAVTASSLSTGRAVQVVGWIWPATLGLFVIQSGLALRRRLITSLLAVPIFVANALVFLAALVRYSTLFVPDIHPAALGIDIAHATTLSGFLGKSALWSPLAIQLPLLSPAYPARWRVSKTVRAAFAVVAAASALLMILHYPRAVRAAVSFDRLSAQRLSDRSTNPLDLGLRVFPTLGGPPGATAFASDLPLADSLGVKVLSVVLAPSGTDGASLDSLRNALAALRADSIQLAVTLGYGSGDRRRYETSPSAFRDERLAMLDAIVRRLRPDLLVPALDPLSAGHEAIGDPGSDFWMDFLRRAGEQTHRLRPRTLVGFSVSAFTDEDSVLYAWARDRDEIDVLGFSLAPSFGGGSSLSARLRVAERWMRGARKPHWVFSARAFPFTFGELNQARAVVGSYAWATRQPGIRVFIAEGAGDYDELCGFRAPTGRLRAVVASLGRAHRALQDGE